MFTRTRAREDLVRIALRPTASTVPVRIRLRRLLKVALRAFGFRCVAIQADPTALDSHTASAAHAPQPSDRAGALHAPVAPEEGRA